jgi:hypothetical protein
MAGGGRRSTASVAAVTAVEATPLTAPTRWSPADLRMRRLLRLPTDTPRATEASARQLVERSLLISMARCLLTYIVLPFVIPVIGLAADVTPFVGIVVGIVAIGANVASVRRFWRAEHRYRWAYTGLATVIVMALVWLIVADVAELVA